MNDRNREIMKVKEVSEYLGISLTKTYECLKSGEIPSLKIGRKYLVRKTNLENLFVNEA
jgi:excisionase family DNA binding protein